MSGRFLHTHDLAVPEIMREERDREFDEETIRQFIRTGLYEERTIAKTDLVLYMSEKEVGLVAFHLQDERYDFLGFTSKDERAHKWCRDLFMYYWELNSQVNQPHY